LKPRRLGQDGGKEQLDEEACGVIKDVIMDVIKYVINELMMENT